MTDEESLFATEPPIKIKHLAQGAVNRFINGRANHPRFKSQVMWEAEDRKGKLVLIQFGACGKPYTSTKNQFTGSCVERYLKNDMAGLEKYWPNCSECLVILDELMSTVKPKILKKKIKVIETLGQWEELERAGQVI